MQESNVEQRISFEYPQNPWCDPVEFCCLYFREYVDKPFR